MLDVKGSGMYLKPTKFLNILTFADDPAIVQDSEDNLQLAVYILNKLIRDKTGTLLNITKTMAFRENNFYTPILY